MDLVKLGKELMEKYPEIKFQKEKNSDVLASIVFAKRIQQKLSQSQLAERLNVEEKIIHKLEGGSTFLGDAFYEKVFAALGLNYEDYKHIKEEEML